MKFGYARVSTDDQDHLLQRQAMREDGVVSTRIFAEKASGKGGARRPALAAAMRALRKGDTLVVWKLDRLGRDLAELIKTVRQIEDKGANLRVLTMHLDTSTPAGKFMFHIFGALAEFERELIKERTMAGLKAARAEGRVGGRKPWKMDAEKEAQAIADLKAGTDPRKVAAGLGVSDSLIYQRRRGRWKKEIEG